MSLHIFCLLVGLIIGISVGMVYLCTKSKKTEEETCPECGAREYEIIVFPECSGFLCGDSSFIPAPRKRCKDCGAIYGNFL